MYPFQYTSEQIQEDICTMFEGIALEDDDFKTRIVDDLCDIVVHRMKDALVREMRVDRLRPEAVESIMEDIAGQHRTHQASIIRNLLTIVAEYHKAVKGSDQRNIAAITASELIDEKDIHRIPFI